MHAENVWDFAYLQPNLSDPGKQQSKQHLVHFYVNVQLAFSGLINKWWASDVRDEIVTKKSILNDIIEHLQNCCLASKTMRCFSGGHNQIYSSLESHFQIITACNKVM